MPLSTHREGLRHLRCRKLALLGFRVEPRHCWLHSLPRLRRGWWGKQWWDTDPFPSWRCHHTLWCLVTRRSVKEMAPAKVGILVCLKIEIDQHHIDIVYSGLAMGRDADATARLEEGALHLVTLVNCLLCLFYSLGCPNWSLFQEQWCTGVFYEHILVVRHALACWSKSLLLRRLYL